MPTPFCDTLDFGLPENPFWRMQRNKNGLGLHQMCQIKAMKKQCNNYSLSLSSASTSQSLSVLASLLDSTQ